jgi:hypothetical protein
MNGEMILENYFEKVELKVRIFASFLNLSIENFFLGKSTVFLFNDSQIVRFDIILIEIHLLSFF